MRSSIWERLGLENEITLISNLYETFGGKEGEGQLILEGHATRDDTLCKYPSEEAVQQLEVCGGLVVTNRYFGKVHGADIVQADFNWDKIRQQAELLHDNEADEPWGKERQKQFLKERILSKRREVQSPTLTISEAILPKFSEYPPPIAHISENRPERHVKFMATIRRLEEESWLKVLGDPVFDFEALPEEIHDDRYIYSYNDYGPEEYLPAEHCKVKIKLLEEGSGIEIDDKNVGFFIPKTPVKEALPEKFPKSKKPTWEIIDGCGYVVYGEKKSKPLKNLKGRQAKLAEQLCELVNKAKSDEETYKTISKPSDNKRYSELTDSYRRSNKIAEIIDTTIGELQRNFASVGLNANLSIHHEGGKVWMSTKA